MSAANSFDDQRQSFRCRVADSRQACALEVGASIVPGRLLNESAGGFSVLVDHLSGLSVDQTATLHTDSGRFGVQVMHVAETAAPPGANSQDSEDEPSPWFRVGLRRLDEIPPKRPSVPVFAESLRFRLRQWCPSGGLFTTPGMFLVLATVVVPLGLAAMLRYAGHSNGRQATSRDDPWAPSEEPIFYDRSPTRSDSATTFSAEGFEPRPSRFDVKKFVFRSGPRIEKSEYIAAKAEKTLRESVDRLPGAAVLVLPEVARRLQLTKEQQEQIHRIEDATAAAMRNLALDDGPQGGDRRKFMQRRTELLDEAQRKALELLTDQQRAKWAELSGPPPPARQPPAP
jgi:hypothetical protein